MSFSLSKTCAPESFEEDIYLEWEKSGFFNPDNFSAKKGVFCNILPPPNANGELHLGHCSGYTVMDLVGRYQRMLGKKTLLLPGKDHAGIQTQVVYEKKLLKERGLTRTDLGRKKFYDETYAFCQDRMVYMRKQEKKIGLSADWQREKFTLDPKVIQTVLETFVKMYQEKSAQGERLVYQGERVINWCPRCASALSDFEVEYQEEKGNLYWIKYGPFVLATARPETKLGDTAVAVHPDDQRYQKMIGKTYSIPGVLGDFQIIVVADKAVDPTFGSGAIKVTPAHDFADYEIALRHNLPMKKIINEKGRMMDNCGKYAGLTTKEAREKIIADMQKMGLIDHVEENYQHNLAVCERCKTVIEPLPSKQWFVAMDHSNFSFKKRAREAIEKGQIKIYPPRFKKIMLSWIDNVHDWCISRQIWWGPQIPAWYKDDQIKVQPNSPGLNWQQDEDTFDTWFSSGQWAYSTLGKPKSQDFQTFYPSDCMIMGRDILPLWAFRMIILSLFTTKKVPFKKLYFTGLVRDEKGQKMSKSKGNGIEPLDMIKKYGTDALRLSLIIGSAPGNDMNLGEAKIEGQRNLINKFWNIARFILSRLEKESPDEQTPWKEKNLTVADRWILHKMNLLITDITQDIENFNFSLCSEKLRNFTWNDLADWYLEICKFETNQKEKSLILFSVLKDLLKLWHPFIPFVTEKIWQESGQEKSLMISAWPEKEAYSFNEKARKDFEKIRSFIGALRNFRAEYGIAMEQKIEISIFSQKHTPLLEQHKDLLSKLKTGIKIREIGKKKTPTKNTLSIFLPEIEILVFLKDVLDVPKETIRLKKEISSLKNLLENLEKRLKNKNFVQKAPEKIILQERERAKNYKEKIEKNKIYLKNLETAG